VLPELLIETSNDLLNGGLQIGALFLLEENDLGTDLLLELLPERVELRLNAGGRLRAGQDQTRGHVLVEPEATQAVVVSDEPRQLLVQLLVVSSHRVLDNLVEHLHQVFSILLPLLVG
jgi:hypothetical protein